jgi:hypothetical protein
VRDTRAQEISRAARKDAAIVRREGDIRRDEGCYRLMKKLITKLSESNCPECMGAGFTMVDHRTRAGVKIYQECTARAGLPPACRARAEGEEVNEAKRSEIKIPKIAGASNLNIGRWFKRVGDPVSIGEPIVEIDTYNLTHELQAPADRYFV